MANTDRPNGFSLVRSLSGQMAPVSMALAASQTIAKGDAVIDNGSGLVAIGLATSGALLGVAAESATSDSSPTRADDRILIYPAVDTNVFSGQCSGDSAAALIATDVDIEGATGVMEVNEDATTEQVARIVGLESDKDVELTLGTNDRVYFIIKRSQWNGYVAAL
jgi:hypothetical protein